MDSLPSRDPTSIGTSTHPNSVIPRRPSEPSPAAAGVWTRDTSTAYRICRAIQAGRVWTNCYHLYPPHAAFGGYKVSGVGRENHKMMLNHYSQTKCLLVSYDQ